MSFASRNEIDRPGLGPGGCTTKTNSTAKAEECGSAPPQGPGIGRRRGGVSCLKSASVGDARPCSSREEKMLVSAAGGPNHQKIEQNQDHQLGGKLLGRQGSF